MRGAFCDYLYSLDVASFTINFLHQSYVLQNCDNTSIHPRLIRYPAEGWEMNIFSVE